MKDNTLMIYMQKIYQTYEKDWMGFKISMHNPVTYHHIIKQAKKGEETLENGAILGVKSHELLNMIERLNIDLYKRWNALFKIINEEKKPIDNELWYLIYELKKETLDFSHPKLERKYKRI